MAFRDFALLLLVCLVWAGNFIVSKLAVADLHAPPLFFSAARLAVVLIAVLPWLLPVPRPVWRMVAVGLLLGAGNFGLVAVALRTASPSSAAVVAQLGVPLTALLSILVLGERLDRLRGLGIALTFVGATAVMWDPSGFVASVGLLFVVGSAFSNAVGAVMMKQFRGVRPLQFQAWVAFSSVLPMAILSVVLEGPEIGRALAGGWPLVGAVLYAALGVSVFAHTIYFGLLLRYEANLVASLSLLCPLMAIGLGVAITGDRFDARMGAGALMALTGVLLILLGPKARKRAGSAARERRRRSGEP